jgi:hypothetical protein
LDIEPPVLGLIHRNICHFLGLGERKVEENSKKNDQETPDFWTLLEAEVVEVVSNFSGMLSVT